MLVRIQHPAVCLQIMLFESNAIGGGLKRTLSEKTNLLKNIIGNLSTVTSCHLGLDNTLALINEFLNHNHMTRIDDKDTVCACYRSHLMVAEGDTGYSHEIWHPDCSRNDLSP